MYLSIFLGKLFEFALAILKIGSIKGEQKGAKISKTGKATPTEIGLHVFHMNLYLHEFFEQILFLTPMDYSPWSEGKFGSTLKF